MKSIRREHTNFALLCRSFVIVHFRLCPGQFARRFFRSSIYYKFEPLERSKLSYISYQDLECLSCHTNSFEAASKPNQTRPQNTTSLHRQTEQAPRIRSPFENVPQEIESKETDCNPRLFRQTTPIFFHTSFIQTI